MHRLLPLLFTILPAAMAAIAGKSKPRKKKDRDDSEVVVKDTGTRPPHGPRKHEVTVTHPTVGLSGGHISHPNVTPSCYQDATASIDLRGFPKWVITFGGSTVSWDNAQILVDFPKGAHMASIDKWSGDEVLDAITLRVYDALGHVVVTISQQIMQPKTVGFTIFLRKAAGSHPKCPFA